jgi:hypothetical protein
MRRRNIQAPFHVPRNTAATCASDWSPSQAIVITRRYASNETLRDQLKRDAWSCALSGCGP